MRKYNRFQRGSAVFKCATCERDTRDTGQGVDHLCMECFNIASWDNQVNDDGIDCPPEIFERCMAELTKIKRLGGNVENVMKFNSYIWPKKPEPKPEPEKPSGVFDIDNSKSYATEKNLMAALEKAGLIELRPLVVCNRKGRFTAVFGIHLSGMAQTGDIMFAARHGFKTID